MIIVHRKRYEKMIEPYFYIEVLNYNKLLSKINDENWLSYFIDSFFPSQYTHQIKCVQRFGPSKMYIITLLTFYL